MWKLCLQLDFFQTLLSPPSAHAHPLDRTQERGYKPASSWRTHPHHTNIRPGRATCDHSPLCQDMALQFSPLQLRLVHLPIRSPTMECDASFLFWHVPPLCMSRPLRALPTRLWVHGDTCLLLCPLLSGLGLCPSPTPIFCLFTQAAASDWAHHLLANHEEGSCLHYGQLSLENIQYLVPPGNFPLNVLLHEYYLPTVRESYQRVKKGRDSYIT